jgi:hypothetical protein
MPPPNGGGHFLFCCRPGWKNPDHRSRKYLVKIERIEAIPYAIP